ncbi:hypothetical protein [Polymorphum gilvum]|uniref:Uncharacterized protein n=1 Tax=Polymorphum gilvum (strain LMG 25793 / CGMCC 1.9160 / SL003B-26A1) TaxID=991905 RepID=F2J546_POLGS|nr:hypothetical protein [Polymorphum gilvum]ADZ70088.1 hypothetical protein SL003B_1660 [Polymorphum gilvum SL003B-26A1]
MKHVDIHPCFSCKLPDCDDQSSDCGLRRACNAYRRCIKKGEEISQEMRAKYNIAYKEIYADRRNATRRGEPA